MKVSRLLPLLCLAVTCGTPAVVTAPTDHPAPDLRTVRVNIIRRDIAWALDTVPLLKFPPFDHYAVIRLHAERCSGLTREGWPAFYVAPISPMPGWVLAFYDEDRRAIVFSLGSEMRRETVLHELLHFLLAPHIPSKRRTDENYEQYQGRVHPDSIFSKATGKCGPLLYPTDPNGDE